MVKWDRISQQLTSRLRELAERYDRPLPSMFERIEQLEAKVYGHLERMGFVCSESVGLNRLKR